MTHDSGNWDIPREFLPEKDETRWTQCPEPFDDESFSSWFVRLAKENCVDPLDLYYTLIGNNRPFSDIEREIAVKSMLMGSLSTHLEMRSEMFSEKQRSTHSPVRIQIAGEYLNSFLKFPRYCPICLLNDDSPYFRYNWQYPFITICPVHHVLLFERCPTCYNPVHYWRTGWDDSPSTCFRCGENLAKNFRTVSNLHDHRSIQTQEDLLEIRENNHYHGEQIKSNNFFRILWAIAISDCNGIDNEEPLNSLRIDLLHHGLQLGFNKFVENPPSFFATQVSEFKGQVKPRVIDAKPNRFDRKPIPDATEAELEIAEHRYQVIMAHLNNPHRTSESGIKLAESNGISQSTLYRWIGFYKHNGYIGLVPQRRSGRGRNKFPPEVEAIMATRIKGNIGRPDPIPIRRCWLEVTEILTRLGYESTEIPRRCTFRKRYYEILDEFG